MEQEQSEPFVYNEEMGKILLNRFLEEQADLLDLIEELEQKIECFPKLQVLILQPPELTVETEGSCEADESSQTVSCESLAIIDPISIKHEVVEDEEANQICNPASQDGMTAEEGEGIKII